MNSFHTYDVMMQYIQRYYEFTSYITIKGFFHIKLRKLYTANYLPPNSGGRYKIDLGGPGAPDYHRS